MQTQMRNDIKNDNKLKQKHLVHISNTSSYISQSQKNNLKDKIKQKQSQVDKSICNKTNIKQNKTPMTKQVTGKLNKNFAKKKKENTKIHEKNMPSFPFLSDNPISIYTRNKDMKFYTERTITYIPRSKYSNDIHMKRIKNIVKMIILKYKITFFSKLNPYYRIKSILKEMLFVKILKNRFLLLKRITRFYKAKHIIYIVLYQKVFDTLIKKLSSYEKDDLSFYFYQPRHPLFIRNVSYINKQFNTTMIEYDVDEDDEEGNSVIITKKMEKTIIPKHSARFNNKRKVNIYENKLNKLNNSIFTRNENKHLRTNEKCFTERQRIKETIVMKFNMKAMKLQNNSNLNLIDNQLQIIYNKKKKPFILRYKFKRMFIKWKSNTNINKYKHHQFIYHKRSNSCLNIHSTNNTSFINNKIFKKPKITNFTNATQTIILPQLSQKTKQFTFTLYCILRDFIYKTYFLKIKSYATFNPDFSIIELNNLNKSANISPHIYHSKRIRKHSTSLLQQSSKTINTFIYTAHKPKENNCFSISKKETAEQTFLNNTIKYNETEIDFIDDIANHTQFNYSHTLSTSETYSNNKPHPIKSSKIKTKVIHFTKKYN